VSTPPAADDAQAGIQPVAGRSQGPAVQPIGVRTEQLPCSVFGGGWAVPRRVQRPCQDRMQLRHVGAKPDEFRQHPLPFPGAFGQSAASDVGQPLDRARGRATRRRPGEDPPCSRIRPHRWHHCCVVRELTSPSSTRWAVESSPIVCISSLVCWGGPSQRSSCRTEPCSVRACPASNRRPSGVMASEVAGPWFPVPRLRIPCGGETRLPVDISQKCTSSTRP